MADEIKVSELTIKTIRGDTQIYDIAGIKTQLVDASATQDVTDDAFAATTRMVSVLNTGGLCNIALSDSAITVTAANSIPIGSYERLDIIARAGQKLYSKIV